MAKRETAQGEFQLTFFLIASRTRDYTNRLAKSLKRNRKIVYRWFGHHDLTGGESSSDLRVSILSANALVHSDGPRCLPQRRFRVRSLRINYDANPFWFSNRIETLLFLLNVNWLC